MSLPKIPTVATLVAFSAALVLLVASCGGDDAAEPSAVGTDAPEDGTGSDLPVDDANGATPGAVVQDDSGYQPTVALVELTDPQPHPIDEVVISEDGLTLGVRYMGAAEPCSGGLASVVEDDSSITVTLTTGLHPNAAAMSCIAQVMAYELAVPLAAPVGDREIVVADS